MVQGSASSCVVQLPEERKRATATAAPAKHPHDSGAPWPVRPLSADPGAQPTRLSADLAAASANGASAAAQRLYFRVVAANRGGMSIPGKTSARPHSAIVSPVASSGTAHGAARRCCRPRAGVAGLGGLSDRNC
jgi:hypothetical protein